MSILNVERFKNAHCHSLSIVVLGENQVFHIDYILYKVIFIYQKWCQVNYCF